MNDNYVRLNSNVILQDGAGNKYITPNTNNIYDVVKQENYLEIIEGQTKDIKADIKENKKLVKACKENIKIFLMSSVLSPIVLGLGVALLNRFAFGGSFNGKTLISFIVKIMNIFNLHSYNIYCGILAFIAGAAFSYPVGIILSFITKCKEREYIKDIAGQEKQLEYLKNKEEEAKIELEELKSKSVEISTKEQTQEFEVVPVNNDMDYETIEKEIDTAYNDGIAEYKALSRVRVKRNRKY